MTDRIWISWNEQRRNIGLAAAVNARLYMTDRDSPRWVRLIQEFFDSWKIVRRERPSVCFTMNPSIFSSWWLSFLARVYKFRLVTDLHTPNINLTGLKKKLFQMIFDSGIRRSDIVIVTNEIYRESVIPLNPNVVIIPDPLPVLQRADGDAGKGYSKSDKKMRILFVCSFDPDEPVNEVLALDPELDSFDVIVSGDWKKMFGSRPDLKNIRLLGFMPRDEYDRLLLSVDGVMVLTGREGCLCCGAYEAFSAGKPLILSNTRALRGYFGNAPVYTDNSSASILSALYQLKEEIEQRARMVEQERPLLDTKFEKAVENLERTLAGLG